MNNNNPKRVKDLALRLARFSGLIRAGRCSVETNREKALQAANHYLELAGRKPPKRVSTPGQGLEWFMRGADYYRGLPAGIGTGRAARQAEMELLELTAPMGDNGGTQDGNQETPAAAAL